MSYMEDNNTNLHMHEKELDKRVERSRRLLMDALFSLLEEMPYRKISVAHLAERSGVARPTFYLHYKSKDDLLLSYLEVMFEGFYHEVESYFTERSDADPVIATIMFKQWSENAEAAKLLVQEDIEPIMLAAFKQYVESIVERFIAAHDLPISNSTMLPYVVDFMAGASYMVITRWIREGMEQSPEELGDIYATLVRPGLLAVLLSGKLAK